MIEHTAPKEHLGFFSEGGISELVDELNGSKVMYAYCKVMDPNTSLPKYVLINWVSYLKVIHVPNTKYVVRELL